MNSRKGFTLLEMAVVLLLLGLGVALSVPALARIRSGARTAAAAREVAVSFQALRWKSVASARSHGWFFEQDGSGWFWTEVRDGNGNGLRTAEIRDGTDRVPLPLRKNRGSSRRHTSASPIRSLRFRS